MLKKVFEKNLQLKGLVYMKLNHVNLSVTYVKDAREFLENYFEMNCEIVRGNAFALMYDDSGLALTLMKEKPPHYPRTFHIGFYQKSEEQVDQINQRLREDGYDVDFPTYTHGGYAFYVNAPGGFVIEITYYPND